MIDVQVKGLIELQRKTERMVRDIHGAPMLNAMRDSTLLIQRKAKINSPVDTGRLRASIVPEIRESQNDIFGVIGTNVIYAPYQEYGTRRGIRPKRYMQRAFDDSIQAIKSRFDRAIREIVK